MVKINERSETDDSLPHTDMLLLICWILIQHNTYILVQRGPGSFYSPNNNSQQIQLIGC